MKFDKPIQRVSLLLGVSYVAPTAVDIPSFEGKRAANEPELHTAALGNSNYTTDLIASTVEVLSSQPTNSFYQFVPSHDNVWSEKDENRYDDLVTKEAVGTIESYELAELEALQVTRRRLVSPPTGEEILQRYRRDKLDQQLLELLGKNVRISALTTYSSKAKAS